MTAQDLVAKVPPAAEGTLLSATAATTVLTVLETAALGFKLLTICAVIFTLAGLVLLGPFGFFPALLIAPLALLTWAAQRMVQLWKARFPSAEFEEPVLLQALSPTPHPVMNERRLAHTENVARVHHTLPSLLEILENEQSLAELVKQFRSLRILLGEHYADDEAAGGLFEELSRVEPEIEPEVERLRGEHTRILSDLDQLIRGYGDFRLKLQTAKHGRIRTTRHELLETIRAHQRAEDRLIQTVYGVSLRTELVAQA